MPHLMYAIMDDDNNIIGYTDDVNYECPEGCELFDTDKALDIQFGLS